MTAAEMLLYFDLLLDKVGNPYFTDSEKYSFLNNAQLEYIKSVLPSNEGGIVNLEVDQIVQNNIGTLIYETGNLNTSSGELTKTDVNTALNTAANDSEPYIYVLAVSWTKSGNTYPVKFTRHNDWYTNEQNSLKKGSASRPKYKVLASKFVFSPVDDTASIKFTLLKNPKEIGVSQDCELPEHTHKKIVEIATNIASVSLRDEAYKQLNNV